MTNKFTKALKGWIKLWPDFWAIPLVLLGLWISYYAFELLDFSVGTYDVGILQALLIAWVAMVVINTMKFLGIEYNDKPLWKYYKDDEWFSVEKDIISCIPRQIPTIGFFLIYMVMKKN